MYLLNSSVPSFLTLHSYWKALLYGDLFWERSKVKTPQSVCCTFQSSFYLGYGSFPYLSLLQRALTPSLLNPEHLQQMQKTHRPAPQSPRGCHERRVTLTTNFTRPLPPNGLLERTETAREAVAPWSGTSPGWQTKLPVEEDQENQALYRCRPAWLPYPIPRPAPAPPFSDQFPPQHRPSPESPPRVAFRPAGSPQEVNRRHVRHHPSDGGRRAAAALVMLLPPALYSRLAGEPGAAEPLPVERNPAAGKAPFRFAPRPVRFPRDHEFFEVRENPGGRSPETSTGRGLEAGLSLWEGLVGAGPMDGIKGLDTALWVGAWLKAVGRGFDA